MFIPTSVHRLNSALKSTLGWLFIARERYVHRLGYPTMSLHSVNWRPFFAKCRLLSVYYPYRLSVARMYSGSTVRDADGSAVALIIAYYHWPRYFSPTHSGNTAFHTSGVGKSSTSFSWGYDRNVVASVGWHVKLCYHISHVSSLVDETPTHECNYSSELALSILLLATDAKPRP